MSGGWVQDCERILDQMKKLADAKGQDRLDMVRKIRFILFALQRSVTGWLEWANNPDVMANFSLEELQEINKTLTKLVCAFVEYDAKITGHTEMELRKREIKTQRELRKEAQGKKEIFYVK